MEKDYYLKADFFSTASYPTPPEITALPLHPFHFGTAHNRSIIFSSRFNLSESFRHTFSNFHQTVLAVETWLGIFLFTKTNKTGGSNVTENQSSCKRKKVVKENIRNL